MKLTELATAEAVLLPFHAKDKWEAIEKLLERAMIVARVPNEKRQALSDALVAREKIASTGMEHGIALPHASVDVVEEPLAAVGIAPQGVSFESQDGQPATILILLVIPKKLVQKHIRTLAGIARILNLEHVRTALLQAQTAAEVIAIFQKEEQAATP